MANINDAWLFAPQSYWFFIVAVFVVTNDLLPTPRYKRGAEESTFICSLLQAPCPLLVAGLSSVIPNRQLMVRKGSFSIHTPSYFLL